MKLENIIFGLEEFAPLKLQEDYDNCGLIVGNPTWEIKGALLSLDCTEAVIDEAIKKNVNLVIAHHPIVFKGLKNFTGSDYIQKTIIKAIKNDIAIYAIHTNLDNVINGVNYKIADVLKLQNLSFLNPKEREDSGSGIIGELTTPMEFSDFLSFVKSSFNGAMIRYTNEKKGTVKTVALCGGSGSFLLSNAIKKKADVFISSDFKYHQFFDAENKINIVDIGHYEAEIFTKELIGDILTKKFPKFAFYLSGTITNPVNYY